VVVSAYFFLYLQGNCQAWHLRTIAGRASTAIADLQVPVITLICQSIVLSYSIRQHLSHNQSRAMTSAKSRL